MGIHISLYRNTCEHHPEWDWVRHSGDSQFPAVLANCKQITKPGFEDMVRPAFVDQLRAGIRESSLEQPERFLHLCDLLERDTDYWIYFGY
jgi:hypothetical protein